MNLRIKDNKIDTHFPRLKYGKLLQTLLKNLNLKEEEIESFINCSELELEDPFKIFGMKKAVKAIKKAIENKQKIVIHGDFDVDGACATAILWDYLYYQRGADVTPIIPHRVDEGYGLSEKTLHKTLELSNVIPNKSEESLSLSEKKSHIRGRSLDFARDDRLRPLLITVDCGIKDWKLVDEYKDRIDFVITDHHQFATDEKGKVILPKAKAVVHSAHEKSKFSCMVSGAATAWQLVRAMDSNKSVIPNESEESLSLSEKKSHIRGRSLDFARDDNVTDYLDLVAISTVCDIIPLTVENRKLIKKGLKKITENNRIGLAELMKVSSIDPKAINAFHFGFVLGPRLNAPGRVTNDATDALRLLATKNPTQAKELAQKLDELNIKRKELTTHFMEIAEKQIDKSKKAIVVLGENWPEGILGLIAGKLAEKHRKPTFVGSVGEEDHIIGSSRSPLDSFYLNKALEHAKDYLERYGGHKQAAGFASNKEKFVGFEDKVLEYIEQNTSDKDFEEIIDVDLEINDLGEITIKDVEELLLLEPHGMGNPKPVFLFKNCGIKNFNTLGSSGTHLKLLLSISGKEIEAIGFNIAEKYKDLYVGQVVDIIGSLGINEWNGNKKMQIEIKEIMT